MRERPVQFFYNCFQVKIYDMSSETITQNDVLIMATDGLWERVTNDKVM